MVRYFKWRVAIVFPLVLLQCVYLFLVGANFYYAKRASYLLHRIRTLQVDQSAIGELEKLGSEHGLRYDPTEPGNCKKIACVNIVSVNNRRMWSFLKSPTLSRLGGYVGLRKWQAVGDIEVQNDKVIGKIYGIALFTDPLSSDIEATAWQQHTLEIDACEYYALRRHHGYAFRNASNIRSFAAEVSDEASQFSREHAFQFDLNCLTSWRRCSQFSQIVPSAWGDYEDDVRWMDTHHRPDAIRHVGAKCPY